MYFISLTDVLPEIGFSETRSCTFFNDPSVPNGSYAFLELYCIDPKCDCQFVRFFVMDEKGQEQACITYGWKDKAFYDKTFLTPDHNFPGPDFAMLHPQGRHARFFLDFCKTTLLQDAAYVERLKRHYALFKKETKKRDLSELIRPSPSEKVVSPSRNSPCLCGSGKKYKKCCYR